MRIEPDSYSRFHIQDHMTYLGYAGHMGTSSRSGSALIEELLLAKDFVSNGGLERAKEVLAEYARLME